MKIDVKDLLADAGLKGEAFYPGKRLVAKYVQHGEHKSHCAVFGWNGGTIRMDLKAGTSGGTLDAKTLRQYPVSFQAPTYMEIQAQDVEDEDEDDETSRGEGGGRAPKHKARPDATASMNASFSKMADGAVSTLGEIKKFVVMGKEIAKESYEQAYDNLRTQLRQTKVMVMDLMKGVSNVIQKATPGGGLTPAGDETIRYSYDAEKTAPMFGGLTPG